MYYVNLYLIKTWTISKQSFQTLMYRLIEYSFNDSKFYSMLCELEFGLDNYLSVK